jgi:hypothetical protein
MSEFPLWISWHRTFQLPELELGWECCAGPQEDGWKDLGNGLRGYR